ncbi:MAG: MGDG synthase family glycosyltransferase [Bacillota bacterium]
MPGGKRRIIVLSVSAGSGHIRAAQALQSAFLEEDPELEVIILDTFKYASPSLEKLVLGAYMEMLRLTPAFYGYIYRQSEKGQLLSGFAKKEFNRLLSRFSSPRLIDFIDSHRPEAVICTHPFPLGVLSALRRQGKFGRYTVGTLTDMTIHPYWIFPEVDLYTVGAERLAGELAGFGIPESRIYTTGIPIDPAFAGDVDRKAVLASCNLVEGIPTILVMGGGLGMGPLEEAVAALGATDTRCQIIVVTGSNTPLKEKIELMSARLPNRVFVLGYCDNVHQLMAVSNIMVSKAGGLSCAEALARRLPILIMDPLPGQEERNAQFLVSEGAALGVSGTDDLVGKVKKCLANPFLLEEMSGAAARLGRPDAARVIAALVRCLSLKDKRGIAVLAGTGRPLGITPDKGGRLRGVLPQGRSIRRTPKTR